jgi:phage terminase large subunit-like protein
MTPEQRRTLLANLKPKAEDIKALPKQAADELFREAEAAADFKRKNKLLTLYPETGPLRRELYRKHMAFFRAGKSYNERAVIAGNRCVSAFTPIEMGSSTRLISELLGEEDFYVTSWDGTTRCKKRAGGVFLKGIEPMFRLRMGNGQVLDCTRRHRVLTFEGWMPISQLIQLSSGLHCRRILQDCQASYGRGSYPCDQQPHPLSENAQARPPLRGDARIHAHSASLHEDALEHISPHTHAYLGSCRPPIENDLHRIDAICREAVDPSQWISDVWSLDLHQALCQSSYDFGQLVSGARPLHGQLTDRLAADSWGECLSLKGSALTRLLEQKESDLSLVWISSGQSKWLFGEDTGHISTVSAFFPYTHPGLIGDVDICSIIPIGMQPVLDFTVEETHNYVVGGVVNSNTGKSFGIGGYETALHLTGLYPPFWEGRRFHYPIEAWVAGDTSETTRDIIQQILLGNPGELGTGLIPYDCILGNPTHRAGVAGAVDTVRVRHVSGGTSWCGFKCFAPGTLVTMGDAALKKVEDIAVGEAVLCADGSVFPVSATFHYPAAPLVRIRAQLGEITVTPNHKMFAQRGKIPAGELTILDQLELGAIPGEFDQICSIDLLGSSEVYCIEVENKHELIANGFRVSNSYDQGRAKFQGTSKDLVWLDESAPMDVYTECLTRLLTRNGIIMLTFTPLDGITDVVLKYLPHMAPDTEDDNIGVDLA